MVQKAENLPWEEKDREELGAGGLCICGVPHPLAIGCPFYRSSKYWQSLCRERWTEVPESEGHQIEANIRQAVGFSSQLWGQDVNLRDWSKCNLCTLCICHTFADVNGKWSQLAISSLVSVITAVISIFYPLLKRMKEMPVFMWWKIWHLLLSTYSGDPVHPYCSILPSACLAVFTLLLSFL